MRLSPHSRRGIWLLAGAVWLAACAGLWWALPVVPRAVLRLETNTRLIALGPNSTSALVLRSKETPESNAGEREYTLDLIEVLSSRRIRTLRERLPGIWPLATSSDARIVLFRESNRRFWRADLDTGTVQPLAIDERTCQNCTGFNLSRDGRYCALQVVVPEHSGVQIWDLEKNQIHAELPGLFFPMTFLFGGRYIALRSLTRELETVNVFDIETMRTQNQLSVPPGWRVGSLSVSGDDRRLGVGLTSRSDNALDTWTLKLLLWDVTTGQVDSDVLIAGDLADAVAGARFLVHNTESGQPPSAHVPFWSIPFELTLWSLDHGSATSYSPNFKEPIDLDYTHHYVSPNGRTLLMQEPSDSLQPPLLNKIAEWFGMHYRLWSKERVNCRLYDTIEAREVGTITSPGPNGKFGLPIRWLLDGEILAVREDDYPESWRLWDIPPRKPLTWFAASAAFLALPIGLLAWWRVRRLRAA